MAEEGRRHGRSATNRSSRSPPTRWMPKFPRPVAGVLSEIRYRRADRHHQHRGCGDRRQCGNPRQLSLLRRALLRQLRQRRRTAPARAATASASTGETPRSSPLVRKIAKENNVDLAQDPGHRSFRPHHQARTSSAICEKLRRGSDSYSGRCSAPACCTRGGSGEARARCAPAPLPGELVPMSKMRSHHRAPHGRVQADQPARPHRLQGGHDPHRPPARKGEVEVRAAQRRQADLHAVHHPRRHRRPAQASHRQRRRSRASRSATTRTSTSASPSRWSGD